MGVTTGIVAFENKETGARIEGVYIADTGISWMVKPEGKPVQALLKSEWWSVPVVFKEFEDIFRLVEGGLRRG